MATKAQAAGAAKANYLWGDPVSRDPIKGGRLEFDAAGLRFKGPGGDEIRLPLGSLLAISISGRTAEKANGRRAIHGTMRVAGVSHGEPTEWVFAVDRSAGAALKGQVDGERATRGEPPLPHVEELVGFPQHQPPSLNLPERVDTPAPMDRVAAELGHRLDAADGGRPKRRRRLLPWVILGGVLVAAEVIVPLVLLRGG